MERAAPVREPALSVIPHDIVVKGSPSSTSALQTAPFAVTRITGDQVIKAGATSLTGLTTLSPGLQVAPVRTTALTFLRGVGTTITSPNADPAIAITLNGAYVPMEMTASVIFDLDRVEVIPGPQGTLYGRNSTGGVINLTTKLPGDRLALDGFVEFGNYGRIQLQSAADTPITSHLALRTAVSLIEHSGFDSNGGDDQDSKAVRATALWTPSHDTTITGIATYSRDDGVGPFNFNVPAIYGPYREADFNPHALGFFIDYRTFTGSLKVDQRLSSQVRLSLLSAYYHLHQQTKTAAWTSTPVATLDAAQANNTVSEEARLDLDTGPLSARAAIYWFHSNAFYSSTTDDQSTPVRETNSNGPFVAISHGWAAYGQGTYSIGPRLRLTGGLRFSQTFKSIDGVDVSSTSNVETGTATIRQFPYSGAVTLNHVDWKVGAEADVLNHSMVYGSVSTGVTPGGFSAAPEKPADTTALAFRPAYLTAYAIGLKNSFDESRITLNAEAFWYDYRNYQVSQRNLAINQNNVYTAAKARIYGIQLDGHADLSARDFISASASIQRARALTLNTPAGTFDGFQLPFAPDATLRASYRHLFPLPSGATVEAASNGEWTSSRWGTYTHAPGTFVHPTFRLDATLTFHPAGGRYSISLWGRNLTDAVIPTQITPAPAPAGPGQEFLSPPRTVGVRFGLEM